MDAFRQSPLQRLATPVKFLKGVGPPREELFGKIGLHTVRDVLFYFPRDYEDLTQLRSIDELEDGMLACVQGSVEEIDHRGAANGGTVTGVLLRLGSGHLRAVWFNQPFRSGQFRQGQRVLLSGLVRQRGLAWEMQHPRVQRLDDARHSSGDETMARMLPVYRLCEGLKQRDVHRAMEHALSEFVEDLDEVFSPEFLDEHQLWPLQHALKQLHFPDNAENLEQARRRFVYQELLMLQLALALKRSKQRQGNAPSLEPTAQVDARIRRLFPFELTPGQNRSIAEIAGDMGRSVPMNRLLQGDVGSGKTVVAAYGMLLAVAHGFQAAIMAPTEILARQHFETLSRLLAKSQVRLLLLTGGLASRNRRETLADIAAGKFELVVGTQAMIQEDVEFARLGLVVIDEQHKFGVRQRAALKGAGLAPHYLVMTATPIPRTVTMTQFGDLDVSLLQDSPPGRQTVHTYLSDESKRAKWWDFFRRKLREGRQGYVVTPRIGESELGEPLSGKPETIASVEEEFESLANGELEAFRLGLIHGRMSAEQKDAQMTAFRRGELQVLVCTSVVEVGVDVPGATLMTIENGERFGLSQLHQLRGRISRGAHPGFCTVFADPKTEEARQRLEAFISTTDGFRLAEIDFTLRGPGDLFSARQHGLPSLRIADLARDTAVLEEARRDAMAIIEADPTLSHKEHARMRERVMARYGKALQLADVG